MDTELFAAVEERVRPLIDLVDELRSMNIAGLVSIPQIAVVGDQSSGKSSLLEAISGVEFPRGTGMVTKCATELILRKKRTGDSELTGTAKLRRNGEGKDDHAQTFTSLDAVGDIIKDLTAKLMEDKETNRDIALDESIVIEVTGPAMPDLTLIDLPGLIVNTTADQSPDLIAKVEGLVARYIRDKRTIVLAVCPCTHDIATVKVLREALKYDKAGTRTLAVLTKADMCDKGAEDDLLAVLRNEKLRLLHGYTAVKTRSQAELKAGLSHADSRAAEMPYLRARFAADESLLGVGHLTAKLTDLLARTVSRQLPAMRRDVEAQRAVVETELGTLQAFGSDREMAAAYASYDARARAGMADSIADGAAWRVQRGVRDALLARLKLLHKSYVGVDSLAQLKDAMAKEQSRSLPGFLDFKFFSKEVQAFVTAWAPAFRDALAELRSGVLTVLTKVVSGAVPDAFPRLRRWLTKALKDVVDGRSAAAAAQLDQQLKRELAPSTCNHYYLDTVQKLVAERMEPIERDMEAFAALQMQTALHAYSKVAFKRAVDVALQILDVDFMSSLALPFWVPGTARPSGAGKHEPTLGDLFDVDASKKARRAHLVTMIERLARAAGRLDDFMLTAADDGDDDADADSGETGDATPLGVALGE